MDTEDRAILLLLLDVVSLMLCVGKKMDVHERARLVTKIERVSQALRRGESVLEKASFLEDR